MSRITHLHTHLSLAIAALVLTASAAAAQGTQPAYKRDVPAKLAARAKITEDSAAQVAQAKIPNGKIQAVELENEHGQLQYSYDIKVAGKSGIEEVNVSALDGHVIGVEHESAATVKREAEAEKMEAKKP
jgi:uncharacterized membrane protein YkoI